MKMNLIFQAEVIMINLVMQVQFALGLLISKYELGKMEKYNLIGTILLK